MVDVAEALDSAYATRMLPLARRRGQWHWKDIYRPSLLELGAYMLTRIPNSYCSKRHL